MSALLTHQCPLKVPFQSSEVERRQSELAQSLADREPRTADAPPRTDMRASAPLWALLGLCLGGASAGVCPHGCSCSSQLIVCTCGPSEDSLTLEPFHHIDYIAKVFLHSCRRLRIPNDTFAGMAIGEELVVTGIGDLRLEPFSFRELLAYPRQMQFRDVGMAEIPAMAFAGLHDAQHLWFRNATIGAVRGKAFSQVRDLDYLYFRETRIGKLEAGAFSGMRNIGHLFIRGSIRLDRVEDHIFLSSSISEKLEMEDAWIGSLSHVAFAGLAHFRLFRLRNCTVRGMTYAEPRVPYTRSSSGEKVELWDSSIGTLSLGAFSNVRKVHLRGMRVEEVLASARPLANVSELRIQASQIGRLSEHALAKAVGVRVLRIEETSLGRVGSRAFEDAEIGTLAFRTTKISVMEEGALSGLHVGALKVSGCRIATLQHSSLASVGADSVSLSKSQLDSVHPRAFAGTSARLFELRDNLIGNLSAFALQGLRAQTLNVSGNELVAYEERSLVGLYGGRVEMSGNVFPCRCDRTYQQLAAMLQEGSLAEWHFGQSLCRVQPTNGTVPMARFLGACSQHSQRPLTQRSSQSLVCEQKGLLQLCTCDDLADVHLDQSIVRDWSPHLAAVSVSGCERLSLGAGWLGSLPHLASLRLSARHLHLAPATFQGLSNLARLEISHASLVTLPSLAFRHLPSLDSLRFESVRISRLERRALSDVKARSLLFHKCRLGTVHTAFLDPDSGTRIRRLNVSQSSVERLETGAFLAPAVQRLTISASSLGTVEVGLFGAREAQSSLCLRRTALACTCHSARGLADLERLADASALPGCPTASSHCQDEPGLSLPVFLRLRREWASHGCDPAQGDSGTPAPSISRAREQLRLTPLALISGLIATALL